MKQSSSLIRKNYANTDVVHMIEIQFQKVKTVNINLGRTTFCVNTKVLKK